MLVTNTVACLLRMEQNGRLPVTLQNPFVGIGTELAPDGKSLSLAGATAVTFKLRSHVNCSCG